MRRLFWVGVGIAVGAIVVRQVGKAAKAYSPGGLAGSARESAVGLLDSVRDFVADVREGMAEREAEIQAAFEQGIPLDEVLDHDPGHGDEDEFDKDGVGVTR